MALAVVDRPAVTDPVSAPFLVAAAFASDLFPSLAPSISAVEVIVTVALVVILYDGGASIGWRRFRVAAVPIVSLGILGTFATAGLVTLFAHVVLGLGWLTAGLLGAAIAPTDPAVVFSCCAAVTRSAAAPGRSSKASPARTIRSGSR